MTAVTTQALPSCVDCGRPMRGSHTLLADQPGTVVVGNVERSLCSTCWTRDYVPTLLPPLAPCVRCNRPRRRASTPAAAVAPGAVAAGRDGLCRRCVKQQGDPPPMTNLRSERPSWPAQPSDWMAQALCAQIGPDLWYPDPGDAHAAQTAAAVCHTCPVRADCLDYAMATETQGDRHGVWGGLTPTARNRLWHEQRKEAA